MVRYVNTITILNAMSSKSGVGPGTELFTRLIIDIMLNEINI